MPKCEYDAFISYKHAKFDLEICRLLHKRLESFRIVKAGRTYRIKRVFLDTEELSSAGSLSQSIQEALDNSRFLIVVCSRETPGSRWVGQEIEYFLSGHDHANVLALLIDGEPDESFPKQLCQVRVDGVIREIEPLAADIRAKTLLQSKRALKREILRLAAPVLGLSYDDLRQRHQRRVLRKTISIASVIAAVLLSFSAFAGWQWYNINEKNIVIQDQSVQIVRQNQKLVDNNQFILEQNNHVLSLQSRFISKEAMLLLENGDRRKALLLARYALPSSLGAPERPYVEEAEMALSEALGAYYYPYSFFDKDTIFEHDSRVQNYCFSPDAELLAVVTSSFLTVWSIEDGEKILSIPCTSSPAFFLFDLAFSDDGEILYSNAIDSRLTAIAVKSGEILWTSEAGNFYMNKSAGVCLGYAAGGLQIIDLETGRPETGFPIDGLDAVIGENGSYAAVRDDSSVYFIDLEKREIIYERDIGLCYSMQLHESICMLLLDNGEDMPSGSRRLLIFDFNRGTLIGEWDFEGYYRAALADSQRVVLMSLNSFEVFDFLEQSVLFNVSTFNFDGYCLQGDFLLLALNSGVMQIYSVETGDNLYSFDCAESIYDIRLSKGVMAAARSSEIFIYRGFNPPNFLNLNENIIWAEFLTGERMLCLISDGVSYTFELWEGTKRLSKIETEYPDNCLYDGETGRLYYVCGKTLYTVIVSDTLTYENEFEFSESGRIKTVDSIPVFYNGTEAVFFLPEGEKTVFPKNGYFNYIYKRGEAILFGRSTSVDIVTPNGETELPCTYINALHPLEDVYVYYKDSQLVFQPISGEEARVVPVSPEGKVENIFFSPDGRFLFLSTETKRLYAADMETGALSEMAAEFEGVAEEAFYLKDTLVIKDSRRCFTFWNPQSLKIVGQSTRVAGFSTEKLLLNNGYNSGIVPFYDSESLMRLADDMLKGKEFSDGDRARYFIE